MVSALLSAPGRWRLDIRGGGRAGAALDRSTGGRGAVKGGADGSRGVAGVVSDCADVRASCFSPGEVTEDQAEGDGSAGAAVEALGGCAARVACGVQTADGLAVGVER